LEPNYKSLFQIELVLLGVSIFSLFSFLCSLFFYFSLHRAKKKEETSFFGF